MTRPYDDDARQLVVCRDGAPIPSQLRGATVAIGNFDGLHLGHQRLIATAVDQATVRSGPSAVLTFDPHPRAYFNPDVPHFRLTPDPVKLKVFSHLGLDAVFVRRFDHALASTSAEEFVSGLLGRDLGVTGVVVGGDFHFGRERQGTPTVLRTLAEGAGISLTVVDTVIVDGEPVSSSRIRDALSRGDTAGANRMLGYRWFVLGPVIHGEKRGRTLGFPTANVRLEPGCSLAHGIYAVRVAAADGRILDGVASFGRRPTFDNGAPLLETHIFDFAGDLYGRPLEVEFVAWIRGEERFASAEDLVRRMELDVAEARDLATAPETGEPRSLIG